MPGGSDSKTGERQGDEIEYGKEPKIAFQILSTTQVGHDSISKPINLAKSHVSQASTISHFKKVHAQSL